jgi:cyclohexanecarboxylate-CoA ligase
MRYATGVRPTRPPDDARRARHEATGAWPQPPLSTLLAARAARGPDRVFVIEGQREGGRSFTFADVAARAERMAVALQRLGVVAGDVVSWQLPNWIESVALAAAIDRVGAVSNPIITIYREQEVGFVCRQSGAKVLIVPGVVRGVDHRELARAVQATAPALTTVATIRAEPLDGQHAFEPLEAAPAAPLPPSPHGPHDVAMIFYTSGTTADPKGVLHTPSTMGSIGHYHAAIFGGSPDDRSLLQFPLTHIGGIAMFVLVPVVSGASVVMMDGYDPALAVDLIERHAVTSAGGPPAILQGMFAAPNWSRDKVRTVRTSGSGAADVSPELMRRVQDELAPFAYRSYGLTECPMVTCARRDDPDSLRHGTDGRAVPGASVRVVDEAGRPVAAGVEGELEVTGPQMCVGYLDAALNVAFTDDGFFRTGDLGIMDAAGAVRITGRRKDVIIRKGENLSAKGIEDALSAHPKVADVAVVGVPDAASGERVCACIVLRPDAGTLTLDEVRTYMEASGVMRQKIPEQLCLLPELPRNATGKVKKDVLRAQLRAS